MKSRLKISSSNNSIIIIQCAKLFLTGLNSSTQIPLKLHTILKVYFLSKNSILINLSSTLKNLKNFLSFLWVENVKVIFLQVFFKLNFWTKNTFLEQCAKVPSHAWLQSTGILLQNHWRKDCEKRISSKSHIRTKSEKKKKISKFFFSKKKNILLQLHRF